MASPDPASKTRAIPPALAPAPPRTGGHRRSFATTRVVLALMLREMSTFYGNSPGGYLWAILEPVGTIIVFAVGFSLVVRNPPLGNSFLLFYASGYLVFAHYREIERTVRNAIPFSRPLLAYPAVTWIDAIIARFALNFLTSTLNTVLILGAIILFTDATMVLDIGPLVGAMGLATLLALGIGTLNSLLTGLFPVWQTVWNIVNRPLMIASAILFTYENVPREAADILWWNPLVHVTGLMRAGVYATYQPQYISVVYVASIGLVCLAFGLLFLRAYHSVIINRD